MEIEATIFPLTHYKGYACNCKNKAGKGQEKNKNEIFFFEEIKRDERKTFRQRPLTIIDTVCLLRSFMRARHKRGT